jgi:SAM-dependent methyltransferase
MATDRTEAAEDDYRSTGRGFSEAAITYDQDEEGNPVLVWMRERAWEIMSKRFPPGSRLLELGSGTGIEAERLAAGGREVALVDVAEGMLERASAKVRSHGPAALLGAHLMPAARIESLVDIYGEGSFDGAYSSFGPLNCEPSLVPVAQGLARLVRPGGHVVLSIINRVYPFEIAWYALHGDLRRARRRLGGPVLAPALAGGESNVMTWYYTPADAIAAFAPWFDVASLRALALLVPPPYLPGPVRRAPGLFKAIGKLDDMLSPLPVLRGLGDHFLVDFTRRR